MTFYDPWPVTISYPGFRLQPLSTRGLFSLTLFNFYSVCHLPSRLSICQHTPVNVYRYSSNLQIFPLFLQHVFPLLPPVTVSVYVSMCIPWDNVRGLFSGFLSNCRSPTRLDIPRSHCWHENLFMRQRYQKDFIESFSEFFRIQHSKSFVQNYLIRNFWSKRTKRYRKNELFLFIENLNIFNRIF